MGRQIRSESHTIEIVTDTGRIERNIIPRIGPVMFLLVTAQTVASERGVGGRISR
jgi:hypothetical protein